MAEDNRQAAAATSTPEKPSVGEILKEARNAQGLTLEQVATELRIELPQLEALETDRFERIGVPVFVKGYLRQYAMRLGLDPRDLLARYSEQTKLKEVLVQPSKTIKLHDERQITVWVIAALAILVVIVGLGAWWVGAGGPPVASAPPAQSKTTGDAKPAPSTPEPATAPASGDPTGGPAAPPAEPAPSSAPSTPAVTPPPSGAAATATTTLAVATPPPSARAAAERSSLASSPRAAAPNATATSPPPTASAAEPNSDDGPGGSLVVPLDLTFEQESWAEVTDARGARLYYGLGTAGKRAEMRGEPPFAVVLGNANGVKIVVDGEDFAIPAKGKPGEYARFSVNVVSD